MVYILAYLAAIVLANATIAHFGPVPLVTGLVAFTFIGADLMLRDKIHDRLGHNALFPLKMFSVIAVGSLLSMATGGGMTRIALASGLAFLLAGLADAAVYHALRGSGRRKRMRLSNIAGAAVDSVVFCVAGFGLFLLPVILIQFIAKSFGSELWLRVFDFFQGLTQRNSVRHI